MEELEVKVYDESFEDQVEEFRQKTFEEGNESLARSKYNPNDPDTTTWMVFAGDNLISISAVEPSHYTGDPDIAARVCRYHILKPWRHTHCGLMVADHQIKWARENNYKILYITVDVKNRAINALYQRKKQMIDPNFKKWTQTEWYTKLKLEPDCLFKVSSKSDYLQYFYSINLQDPNYKWKPKSNVVYYNHNGNTIDTFQVLSNGQIIH